jgi:hypothetical protein
MNSRSDLPNNSGKESVLKGPVDADLECRIERARGKVSVLLNGQEVTNSNEGSGWHKISPPLLKPGDNKLTIRVLNETSSAKDPGATQPQGWEYVVRCHVPGKSSRNYQRTEEHPDKNASRTGEESTSSSWNINVDPQTGRITFP